MTNAERIEVLRYCGADKGCLGCPLDGIALTDCFLQVMIDAADALETDEKRIAELEEEHNKTVTAIFLEEQLWWEDRCKELEAERMELIAKCRRLQAQMKTVTDCHASGEGER